MAKENVMNYDAKDAEAFVQSGIASAMSGQGTRFDADDPDGSIWFARELDHVKTRTYDKKYPEFNGLRLFPVSHEVNPGAETVTYYSYEKVGMAKLIANYSTDLPRADVKGSSHTSDIRSIGVSYGYSMQDMRASKMAGKSLDTRRGEAARFQNDKLTNDLIWKGDADAGLIGIYSANNNIPVYTLANSTANQSSTAWKDKTADEIFADVIGMISYMAQTTMDVENPYTIVLPPSVVRTLAGKRIDGTDTNCWKYLRDNVPGISHWEEAQELENRYTGVGNAILVYKKDAEKLTFEVPLAFYQYPAQPKNLEVQINCESRVGGLIIYYPMSLMLAYGI